MVMDSKSLPTAAEEETGSIKHQRCGAITKSGQPCGGRPSESGFCFAHDPAFAATRETARVRGGKNSSSRARLEKLMPERLRPTFELLEKAVTEVYEGSALIGTSFHRVCSRGVILSFVTWTSNFLPTSNQS